MMIYNVLMYRLRSKNRRDEVSEKKACPAPKLLGKGLQTFATPVPDVTPSGKLIAGQVV